MTRTIIFIFFSLLSVEAHTSENDSQFIESFCDSHYKNKDNLKNADYWTVSENDFSAICYIRTGDWDAKYTLILKDSKKGWKVNDKRLSDDDIAWLRKTLIGYQYKNNEWDKDGLPVINACKVLSSHIAKEKRMLKVYKYLYSDYDVLQYGNSEKYVKGNLTCITEFVQPNLNGGQTFLTYTIEYNQNNGVYEYERDKRYESGGTAYSFEREIKAIVKNRKNKGYSTFQ